MRACMKCGVELPERTGPGRPPSYCSLACRRAAELEIRRLNRRIERTEDEAADWGRRDPSRRTVHGTAGEYAARLRADVAEMETRLAVLLAGRDEKGDSDG